MNNPKSELLNSVEKWYSTPNLVIRYSGLTSLKWYSLNKFKMLLKSKESGRHINEQALKRYF